MQPIIPHPIRDPSPPHLFLLVHMAAFAECRARMVEMYGEDATVRIISILNEQSPESLAGLIEHLEGRLDQSSVEVDNGEQTVGEAYFVDSAIMGVAGAVDAQS